MCGQWMYQESASTNEGVTIALDGEARWHGTSELTGRIERASRAIRYLKMSVLENIDLSRKVYF